MSALESVILGITQALTEFLPVSSSAHLKLVKQALGTQENVLLDLSCHLGTSLALIFFLRKELLTLTKEKLKLLFLALLPLPPCYFLLKPLRVWAGQDHLLGPCLMVTACILFAGGVLSKIRLKSAGKEALVIGGMQAMALIPGISRSASTISSAKLLGWSPKEAVRFSFLLSIPTILAGSAWELLKLLSKEPSKEPSIHLFLAFATSFLLALFLVGRAIRWLEKGNLKPCAWYCFALGAFLTLYFNL